MILLLTEGQVSGHIGAKHTFATLPRDAKTYIADRGYDANWLREALCERGITPCIPARKNCIEPIEYDADIYKRRNIVERMCGRLKDWRRIAMRYHRCAHTIMSTICIAASVVFWL